MNKTNIKVVGDNDNPIKIYWDMKESKTDEYLLLLSICSGAYGIDNYDFDSFKDLCTRFFRYAKKNEKYYKQLSFVLTSAQIDCVDYLESIILDKWNTTIEYERDDLAIA